MEEELMKNSGYFLGLFVLVLAYASVGTAAAPPLTFHFSDVVATKTAMETDSYAVNDAGVIAGDYIDSAGVQHGMFLNGKKLITFDDKECASGTALYSINSKGVAAGSCNLKSGGFGSFIVYPSVPCCHKVTVAFPKALETEATGINDEGDVTGLYLDSAGVQHGFVKKGKTYTTIDVKGDTDADAYAINNAGVMTVYAVNSAGGYDSFLYNGKKFTPIRDPNAGTLGTIVHTPNNKGQVDGSYYDSAGDVHGFLLDGGHYYTLDDPTGCKCDTRADGLNDNLEIVGRYSTTLGGASIGFKATTKQ
jgi:hypothetical protein